MRKYNVATTLYINNGRGYTTESSTEKIKLSDYKKRNLLLRRK